MGGSYVTTSNVAFEESSAISRSAEYRFVRSFRTCKTHNYQRTLDRFTQEAGLAAQTQT